MYGYIVNMIYQCINSSPQMLSANHLFGLQTNDWLITSEERTFCSRDSDGIIKEQTLLSADP